MDDSFRYIALSQPSEYGAAEEQLLNAGADIIWRAPLVGCLGVRIPEEDDIQLFKRYSNLSKIRHFLIERMGGEQPVNFENTADMTVEPKYDERAEIERIAEEIAPDLGVEPGELLEVFDKSEENGQALSGVTVAIIDSGVDTCNEQLSMVKRRINYTDDYELDDLGHGTAVALMNLYTTPYEEIYDLKVVSKSEFSESSVIQALNDAIILQPTIVQMSLGFSSWVNEEPCILCKVANLVADQGILVFSSAGNHGIEGRPPPTPTCPANANKVIAHGSLNESGEIATYSGTANIYGKDEWFIGGQPPGG